MGKVGIAYILSACLRPKLRTAKVLRNFQIVLLKAATPVLFAPSK
jgi:hypothetical protein